MKRRWFQFSLRTAVVAMVVAAIGAGVYLRLPYYRAGQALDRAMGNKSFPAWRVVREALIYDSTFRQESLWGHEHFVGSMWRNSAPNRVTVSVYRDEHNLLTRRWDVIASEHNSIWTARTSSESE